MTDNSLDRITPENLCQQRVKCKILDFFKRQLIAAFKLDPDRKIVALITPLPAGNTGMPGASQTGDKLEYLSIAANQKMG